MRIIGIIPARGGSKGVPRKNIKKLKGKELIRYSIEVGLACPLIEEVLVSTEDKAIAAVSRQAGATVPFLRPTNLAGDSSPVLATIIHLLNYLDQQQILFDAICLLQPTVPFRSLKDVNVAIQQFIQQKADSLISVREVPHIYNPHWVYEAKEQWLQLAMKDIEIIPRRQELPTAYHRDGSIYLTKKEVILKQHSLYGDKIAFHVTKHAPDINIDTMKDWQKATQYAENEYRGY